MLWSCVSSLRVVVACVIVFSFVVVAAALLSSHRGHRCVIAQLPSISSSLQPSHVRRCHLHHRCRRRRRCLVVMRLSSTVMWAPLACTSTGRRCDVPSLRAPHWVGVLTAEEIRARHPCPCINGGRRGEETRERTKFVYPFCEKTCTNGGGRAQKGEGRYPITQLCVRLGKGCQKKGGEGSPHYCVSRVGRGKKKRHAHVPF